MHIYYHGNTAELLISSNKLSEFVANTSFETESQSSDMITLVAFCTKLITYLTSLALLNDSNKKSANIYVNSYSMNRFLVIMYFLISYSLIIFTKFVFKLLLKSQLNLYVGILIARYFLFKIC